jgi:hypothetical protein
MSQYFAEGGLLMDGFVGIAFRIAYAQLAAQLKA